MIKCYNVSVQNWLGLTEKQEIGYLSRRNRHTNNYPTRIIYTALAVRCPICLKLHNKSKQFGTPYHLLYHINDHDLDDQTTTLITLEEIRFTIKQICRAIEWRMLFV